MSTIICISGFDSHGDEKCGSIIKTTEERSAVRCAYGCIESDDCVASLYSQVSQVCHLVAHEYKSTDDTCLDDSFTSWQKF